MKNTNFAFLLNSKDMKLFTYRLASIVFFSFFLNQAFAQVSGTVFKDFNENGIKEATATFTEPGIAGVTVKAFDASGAQVGATATTDATGAYSIAGVSGALRIEFTNFPNGIYEGPKGTASNTSVQFVTAPATNINLGINCPEDYCQSNPKLLTPCYENGSGVGNTNPVFVGIDYTDTGTSTQNEYPTTATAVNMGTVWGVAYDKRLKFTYTSAFLKRQAGLGPRGLDGIYVLNNATGVGSLAGGIDLEGVVPSNGGGALAFGSVTRTLIASGNGNGINDLSASRTNSSRDADAYAKVAKVGYGDIDIDESNKTLWAVNLNERSLVAIDISTSLHTATVPNTIAGSKVKRYFIDGTTSPSITGIPSCPNGVMRPWALKIRKGTGYLGVVCDGSSLSTVDMSANQQAYVLSFDAVNPTAFTVVASVPLNYNREQSWVPFSPTATFDALESDNWQRWIDTYSDPTSFGGSVNSTNADIKTGLNGGFIGAPQPILSDIEFLPDGSMALGFIDRFAHQQGWANYIPTSSTVTRSAVSHGDILLAYKSGGSYVFEGPNENDNFTTPAVAANAQPGQELNDGPSGAGEFFYKDYYVGFDATHPETALGGLAVLPGSNEITAISFDPEAFNSMGVRWFNYNTGNQSRVYTIAANTNNTNFGKGSDLGDVELLCNTAPIEIGNRVWKDTDNDGIQDANEVGIANVTVEIYDGTTLIATTTTDPTGNWYFNNANVTDGSAAAGVQAGLQPNKAYTIKIGAADWTAGNGTGDLAGLKLTSTNSTSTSGLVDISDNDAALVSTTPTIAYTTGDYGQNNHSLDFGFNCTPAIVSATINQATCNGATANSDASIAFTSSGADKFKITAGATSTATYATASTITANAGSLTAIANPASATQYTIRVFNGSDACFKDTTITLEPKTCIPPACTLSVTATPSLCSPATNTYDVTGSLTFTNAPTSGTLTVSDGTKTQVFNAPFTSPLSYSLTGITSDGIAHTVTAVFSADNACTNSVNYTAPVSCACPVTNYPICAGESYTLTAQTGMTGYQWYKISGTDTLAISGATSQTYVADSVGKYIWKATDANGCQILLCCPVELIPGACFGSIGDFVWTDSNNNGQQDGTEAPIAGVKVYLLDGTGNKIDSTVTDNLGKYLFDSLLSGTYQVQFVAPAGTIAAKQNTGADVTDSDANTAGLSQVININTALSPTDTLRNNPQIDAGFVPLGSIGDYVFEDKDKSNTQTAGDTPISGVTVYLLDATTGAKLDSTTTDANGLYLFDSLVAGNYKVQFVAPSGTSIVTKNSGTDLTKDSNPDPITGITDAVTIDTTQPIGDPARDNRDVDAGINVLPQYGSLGDYVWMDSNNNGQQDGTETPIAGVKVYLYDGTGTTILDSTLTDALGKYTFDSLITGAYKVKFEAPAGTLPAKQNIGADVTDSDVNSLGWSQVVNINTSLAATDTLRNNPQIDAGFVPFGSIGDYVFEDKDNSNSQTAGDLPIPGVKVYLLDATTGAKLDSTITDSNGLYKFDSLLAGDYKVQFLVPPGMLAVTTDSGTDDTKDSDINSTGLTGTYTVDTTKPVGDPARDITSVDAGLKGVPQFGSIGDYVWSDVNNNGQQDGTEAPIAGVKVYLLDAVSGSIIDSTVTDAAGKYLFDSLLTGSYKVQFVAPTGTIPAKQNTGADVTDSDANTAGLSQVININTALTPTDTLRNNPQIDGRFCSTRFNWRLCF